MSIGLACVDLPGRALYRSSAGKSGTTAALAEAGLRVRSRHWLAEFQAVSKLKAAFARWSSRALVADAYGYSIVNAEELRKWRTGLRNRSAFLAVRFYSEQSLPLGDSPSQAKDQADESGKVR